MLREVITLRASDWWWNALSQRVDLRHGLRCLISTQWRERIIGLRRWTSSSEKPIHPTFLSA